MRCTYNQLEHKTCDVTWNNTRMLGKLQLNNTLKMCFRKHLKATESFHSYLTSTAQPDLSFMRLVHCTRWTCRLTSTNQSKKSDFSNLDWWPISVNHHIKPTPSWINCVMLVEGWWNSVRLEGWPSVSSRANETWAHRLICTKTANVAWNVDHDQCREFDFFVCLFFYNIFYKSFTFYKYRMVTWYGSQK